MEYLERKVLNTSDHTKTILFHLYIGFKKNSAGQFSRNIDPLILTRAHLTLFPLKSSCLDYREVWEHLLYY